MFAELAPKKFPPYREGFAVGDLETFVHEQSVSKLEAGERHAAHPLRSSSHTCASSPDENAHAFLRLSREPSHVDKLDRTLAVLSTIFYVENRSWRSKALVQNIISIRSNLLLVNQACRTGHTKMHGRLPEKSSRAGAAAHSRELGDYILGGAMQPGNRL